MSKEIPCVNFVKSDENIAAHFVKQKVAALCDNVPSHFVIKLVEMVGGQVAATVLCFLNDLFLN